MTGWVISKIEEVSRLVVPFSTWENDIVVTNKINTCRRITLYIFICIKDLGS